MSKPNSRQKYLAKFHVQPPIQFDPADHALVRQAAELTRVPVAQFIREAAIKAAKRVIEAESAKS